jgi:GT2 family glycosyltransferase
MPQPTITALILNTNRCEDTLECIASLEGNAYKNLTVIVLDNHSTDGSVELIRSIFPWVRVIELQENLGYAGNNNVGIQAAVNEKADWVFVLNEDTILAPDCLSKLVEVGESDPGIGIVGPMVYHYNEPEVIQSAGGMLGPYWLSLHLSKDQRDQGQYCDPHAVEWISGCAILVRREVIEQVGMIDDRFFIYWEETEWCLRAGRAGWRIVHVPMAKIWHKGVQRDFLPKPSFFYYATRNRFLMLAKHRAPARVWLVAWTQTLRTLVSWTVKPQWRSMKKSRDAMWRGLLDFLLQRWGGPVHLNK